MPLVLQIPVPEKHEKDFLDAFTKPYGYQETVPDPTDDTKTIPNPVTSEQFATVQAFKLLSDQVAKYSRSVQIDTARQQVEAQIRKDQQAAVNAFSAAVTGSADAVK